MSDKVRPGLDYVNMTSVALMENMGVVLVLIFVSPLLIVLRVLLKRTRKCHQMLANFTRTNVLLSYSIVSFTCCFAYLRFADTYYS